MDKQREAMEMLDTLKQILDAKRRQWQSVQHLYNTGIMEHDDVIKYVKVIEQFR